VVAPSKSELRSEWLRAREAQSGALHAERSGRVQDRFLALGPYRESAEVAIYAPTRREVGTERIFSAARAGGKRVSFPRVRASTRELQFFPVEQWSDLAPGSFGVLEPRMTETGAVDPRSIDVIAVPGVAFDAVGHRLGYGGGYYDRFLSDPVSRPRCVVGLGFDFQVVEALPSEPSDAPMDWVVTESWAYPREGAGSSARGSS
jgi:5-formyltetrahydrofolate cyclo-ligase